MNTNRMLEIAVELGDLYKEKSSRAFHEWSLSQDKAARELYLTPVDGWPGKNQAERDTAALRAFAEDEPLKQINQAIDGLKQNLASIQGDIDALEALRRGCEWETRANLVNVLAGAAIERSGNGHADESAFDDVLDHHVDDESFENLPDDELFGQAMDELPF